MTETNAAVNVQIVHLPLSMLSKAKKPNYVINGISQSEIEKDIKQALHDYLCTVEVADILTQKLKGEIDTSTIAVQFALATSLNFDKVVNGVELTDYDVICNDDDNSLLSVCTTVAYGSISCKIIGEATEETAKTLNGVIENYEVDSTISQYISIDDINVEISDIEN